MQQLLELKDAARTMWATGNYDAFLRKERFYQLGEQLVDRAGVTAGQRVLDLACGTGNVAIPAARAGAEVTGADLTPQLLAVARDRADDAGVRVEWCECDAEDLPFAPASFDLVLSAFGCMFAPRHEVVADEIARVLRPGGRLALYTWAPSGAIGEFFQVAGAYLPPLPELAEPPLGWGEPRQVRELFEGTGVTLSFARGVFDIRYDSVADAVHWYTTAFGPVAVAHQLAEADGRGAALRADLAALLTRHNRASDATLVWPAEYLTVLGHKHP